MKYIISILLVALSLNCNAQNDAIKYFINDVVLLEYPLGASLEFGTGTLLFKSSINAPNQDSVSGRVYLVTNKHVLPEFNKSSYINAKISKIAKGDYDTYFEMKIKIFEDNGTYNSNVHIGNNEDVAVIDITELYIKSGLHYMDPFLLPYSLLATSELINSQEISQGDEVCFIGYPSYVFDSRSIQPVLRIGIISTNPNRDWVDNSRRGGAELHGFLIDANVFEGSSGSLVFLKPQPIQLDSRGNTRAGTKGPPYILGILTRTMNSINTGSNNEKINMGQVISSKEIIKVINSFTD